MYTYEDKKNIADFMYVMSSKNFNFNANNISKIIDTNCVYDAECWETLADLINPDTCQDK